MKIISNEQDSRQQIYDRSAFPMEITPLEKANLSGWCRLNNQLPIEPVLHSFIFTPIAMEILLLALKLPFSKLGARLIITGEYRTELQPPPPNSSTFSPWKLYTDRRKPPFFLTGTAVTKLEENTQMIASPANLIILLRMCTRSPRACPYNHSWRAEVHQYRTCQARRNLQTTLWILRYPPRGRLRWWRKKLVRFLLCHFEDFLLMS